jgi:hypothetical protein
VRAIVQIGTEPAYAILERGLATGSREMIVQQLVTLRDNKAVPLLCQILDSTPPSSATAGTHLQIMEALANLGAHPASTTSLKAALYRGVWWAPKRTAALRDSAATALMRIASPETTAVLEEAVRIGGRQVRTIARAKTAAMARRDRDRS